MRTCEDCKGTGWYGDNGWGIKGNEEYNKCECAVGVSNKADEYEKQVWLEHENQLAAKDAEIAKLRADLAEIHEYGTTEINAAVELRQEVARLRVENQRLQAACEMMAPKPTWKEFAKALEVQAKIEVLKEVLAWFENCIGVECDDLVEDKLKQLEGE